jgi:hypothetical protein
LQDASLKVSHVLPADKSLTTVTTAIDLGLLVGISARPTGCELLAVLPALALAKLPNTSVITHTIEACAATSFASGVRQLGVITQTGATGTDPAAAAELRCRLPSDCPQYVRLKSVTDAAGADCSAVTVSLQLVF